VGMKEKIIKFVRDALESKGVVQEMRIVEFDLDEILEYLKESSVGSIGDVWLWMEDLKKNRGDTWYRDYEREKIVVLKVFDSPT